MCTNSHFRYLLSSDQYLRLAGKAKETVLIQSILSIFSKYCDLHFCLGSIVSALKSPCFSFTYTVAQIIAFNERAFIDS